MTCNKCGAQYNSGSLHCPKCGNPASATATKGTSREQLIQRVKLIAGIVLSVIGIGTLVQVSSTPPLRYSQEELNNASGLGAVFLVGGIVLLVAFFVSQNKMNMNKSRYSSADELTKYKELLDKGVISKDEYDAKKDELMK